MSSPYSPCPHQRLPTKSCPFEREKPCHTSQLAAYVIRKKGSRRQVHDLSVSTAKESCNFLPIRQPGEGATIRGTLFLPSYVQPKAYLHIPTQTAKLKLGQDQNKSGRHPSRITQPRRTTHTHRYTETAAASMLRPNWALARCGLLRARHTRPAAAAAGPRRATGVRTAMYKHDKPDGTTSTLEWTPKT